MSDQDLKEKAFDIAVQTRALEIDLFWKRSLFFWSFIASSFAGYAALRHGGTDLALVVACFGLVCSVAWSLLNRGSKYWQEVWETKVERLEKDITGPLFSVEETEQIYKGCWLRGRRYSVSKLAIGLSDYTVLLWVAVVTWDFSRGFVPSDIRPWLKQAGVVGFVTGSMLYVLLLLYSGRSTKRRENSGT